MQTRGSPPRMRGKLLSICPSLPRCRITPAHAGKTTATSFAASLTKDHPRACGENMPVAKHSEAVLGSPPRMRGKPLCSQGDGARARITPAHAGKTRGGTSQTCSTWDHPRACGENVPACGHGSCNPGSPPRMRGKHFGNGVFPWLILVLSLDPL